ncbi:MAG: phosphatidate cytidylyltransferase [Phycisphaerae bacterium]|nr:phosphatidate cytidylyltransferase [Phycisphaerae bacterium]
MLKYRLIFGTLMVIVFSALVVIDDRFGWTLHTEGRDLLIRGNILLALLVLMAIPAQIEMALLAKNVSCRLFPEITIQASVLLAASWYFAQFSPNPNRFLSLYVLIITAFTVLILFLFQARKLGPSGTIVNLGGNLLSILYLGFLSSFFLGIQIEYGYRQTLMFIFTVKSADTGAYTFGRLFGKHKFSPRISPKKTWEGFFGGILFGIIAALGFALGFDIMNGLIAVVFGVVFAVVGQLADLAESMLKRDAQTKDSSAHLPGFGGILDVIDSPLGAAPVAYLFFLMVGR